MGTIETSRISRRQFLWSSSASAAAMLLGRRAFGMGSQPGRDRPNFLWISCEDTGCELGCYGDDYAVTPYLDKFASQGVRYTNAFTHAGVCAPTRSGIITGMYPTTLGTHHMRCKGVLPAQVKCFSEYLRGAGYYCTNNKKTDYQFDPPAGAWDECNRNAHYGDRAPGQPFFAVFNIVISHESQIRCRDKWLMDRFKKIKRHDPARAPVPPYHPDTEPVREDRAQYYDIVTLMDTQAGALLARLDKDGLAENTIVWFWGDHGSGMPRGKRWIYDSGIHVPLLIRVPEKYRKLLSRGRPESLGPGGVNDELVGFVDFAPTMLSLAGIKIPDYIQGQAFLGPQRAKPREYVFAHRDRMDERYDIIRAVRDKRYKYIRNYLPQLSRAQYIAFMDLMPTMQEMRRLNAEGKLKGAEKQYFEPHKPIEELYDTASDRYEVKNVADDPEYADVLKRMRTVHAEWVRGTGDVGLIPEPELDEMTRPGGEWEKTEAPVFNSVPGEKQYVTLSCATKGASIVYKLDSKRGWRLFTGPVRLKKGQMLRARACRIGFIDSDEATYRLGDRTAPPARPVEKHTHWRQRLDHTDLLQRLWDIKQLDYKGRAAIPDYLKVIDDEYASVRYWAVVGLLWRCETPGEIAKVKGAIENKLADPSPAVRIAAAQAMCEWGKEDKALGVLVEMLKHKSNSVRLSAAIALGEIGEKARPAESTMRKAAAEDTGSGKYVNRVCERALALLGISE